MYENRIRNAELRNKIVTAAQAASLIKGGMTIGVSGFTRADDVKEDLLPW